MLFQVEREPLDPIPVLPSRTPATGIPIDLLVTAPVFLSIPLAIIGVINRDRQSIYGLSTNLLTALD